MNFKMWIKKFILLSILGMSIVGTFNYMVDPYGLYNLNIIKIPKIKQSNKMRLVKAIKIQEIKPASICLGTSRAESGYNPSHKYFLQPSYNLATSGSSMYENRLYFDYALKQGKLKKVLLVVDYRMFTNKVQKQIPEFETYFQKQNKFKYLFSLDTLFDSLRTIKGTTDTYILYNNNGQRQHNYYQKNVDEEGGHLALFKKTEKEYYKGYPSEYVYADTNKKSFPDFNSIVKDCYKNNIELDIIFGPSHIRLWEALNHYVGYNKWLQWKKDVVLSVNKIAAQQNKKQFRIMDFSVYHPLTAEKVPTDKHANMKYYWESSHYKNELGLIVLDRLIGNSKYKDFGIELNVTNIDHHLEQQKIKRKQYIDIKQYEIEMWGAKK